MRISRFVFGSMGRNPNSRQPRAESQIALTGFRRIERRFCVWDHRALGAGADSRPRNDRAARSGAGSTLGSWQSCRTRSIRSLNGIMTGVSVRGVVLPVVTRPGGFPLHETIGRTVRYRQRTNYGPTDRRLWADKTGGSYYPASGISWITTHGFRTG